MSKLKDHFLSIAGGAAGGAVSAVGAGIAVVAAGPAAGGAVALTGVGIALVVGGGLAAIAPKPSTAFLAAAASVAGLAVLAQHLGSSGLSNSAGLSTADGITTRIAEEDCQKIRSYINDKGKPSHFVLPQECKLKPAL